MRVNQLFSMSLTCSLLASFGALVGQQWLVYYSKQRVSSGEEKERWEEQRKLSGAHRWQLQNILELVLPSLLQIAVLIFLVGLIAFLWPLSHAVCWPNTVLVIVGAVVFLFTIIFSLLDPFCPFQTPHAQLLRELYRQVRPATRLIPNHHIPSSFIRFWHTAQHVGSKLRPQGAEHGILNAEVVRHVLKTSEDQDVLLDIARNIPLLPDPKSFEVVYRDKTAMRNLALLEANSPIWQSRLTFGEARSHLFVAAASDAIPEELSELADNEFNAIVEVYLASPTYSPFFALPTSNALVAAFFLKPAARDDPRYPNHLQATVSHTPSPIIHTGMISWALVMPAKLTLSADTPTLPKCYQSIFPQIVSPTTSAALLPAAAAAYKTFYKASRFVLPRLAFGRLTDASFW